MMICYQHICKYSNIRRMKFYTEPSIFILITYQKTTLLITNQDLLMKIEIM